MYCAFILGKPNWQDFKTSNDNSKELWLPNYKTRDKEPNTTEKIVDTIDSRSFPGASSESITRKTIILGERGKEVAKIYGTPPDERPRIPSEAEKNKERLK